MKKLRALFFFTVLLMTFLSIPAQASVVKSWDITKDVHADFDDTANTLSIYSDTDNADLTYNATVFADIATYLAGTTTATVDIDWGIGNIASNVFSGADYIGNVVINGSSGGSRTIGAGAFQNCPNLTAVSISGTSTIGNNAFKGCSNLSEVGLGSTSSIGNSAFEGCVNISTINLAKVKTISAKAFKGCNALATINGGSAVTSIDGSALQASSTSPILTYLSSEASPALLNYDYESSNRTLYLSTFKITYVTNNGGDNIVEDVPNGTIPAAPTVTKDGCTLLGWYKESDFRTEFKFDTVPTGNMTLYAKWSDKELEVKFNSMGGSPVETQKVKEGEYATLPTDPYWYGYKFTGWYTDKTLNTVYAFETPVTSNIELFARWVELKTVKVKFKYEDDDDIDIEDQEVFVGDYLQEPEDPVQEGYTFKGWYTTSSFKKKWNFEEDTVTKNMTLYAKFRSDSIQISFDTGVPGLTLSPITVDRGERITPPAAPTAENRTFLYWAKDGEEFDFSKPPKDDMKLTATWQVSAYKVSFETNGGETIDTQMIPPGGVVLEPTKPIRDNYQFAGWYSDAACTQKYTFSTPVNSDMTLYAKWVELGSAEAIADSLGEVLNSIDAESNLAGDSVSSNEVAIPKTGDFSLIPEWFFKFLEFLRRFK